MHCTNCGGALAPGAQFCTACGTQVSPLAAGPAAPPTAPQAPPAPYPGQTPYAGAPSARSNAGPLVVVLIVVVLLVIGAVAVIGLGGFSSGTGDCVYTFEGQTHRYPNYSEAECDAFCEPIQFGGCWWDPYLIAP